MTESLVRILQTTHTLLLNKETQKMDEKRLSKRERERDRARERERERVVVEGERTGERMESET